MVTLRFAVRSRLSRGSIPEARFEIVLCALCELSMPRCKPRIHRDPLRSLILRAIYEIIEREIYIHVLTEFAKIF
jgi:hypothetical protein